MNHVNKIIKQNANQKTLRNSISKQLDIKGRNTKILNLKRAIIEKKKSN